MLVILTHDNILSVNQVCSGCLLADQQGTPRWHHGELGCGHSLGKVDSRQAKVYKCEMGFQVTEVDG
ncbi:hypothetical protein WH8501_27705 [Crocosphaera watsonii WH 8501]|uniref:Uncharacterized protein n=5 Tax=Crocosphaera watsonii TaxID=263511 RepID=T2JRU6_CROWT|nr:MULTISPECIES: hypothetical protein [Crocosphaera]EHJ13881.1 hypothetical protein CWATWH0003_1419 [Crocosphaera watsonii WH 0003]MCH2245531.1 hypothetical protein [Crocosphaera sp.]NQZ65201.1 hypothetical protein [Crocosphaera sp.]CCQ51007.1 hypothetical protein CWATWH8502_3478 [Crocosphaera watsonii WH 8502]CCQ59516.1 hypothetical protein CWATWH0005_2161 [Crocosphaera watsonii WH 0005]